MGSDVGQVIVRTILASLCIFYSQDACDINACTIENQTALHLAVHQGHLGVVERLVGYGVKLNMQDTNGDTPLHFALVRGNAEVLTADTPQMKKVSHTNGMCIMGCACF